MSNIDKQALKPVGKFAFESVGARWHHVKHGEAQITLPKLPLMRLYSEDDVQALLDKLEVADKRIAELEAKLANPVVLPKTNGYWNEQEKAYEEAITLAKRQVRLAGFRCEGDE